MTGTAVRFLELIRSHRAVVGVMCLGYVGLPLTLLFEEGGFPVIGFDRDPAKTEALRRGESYIRHLGSTRVAKAFLKGQAEATSDFGRLAQCDVIVICVPTPVGRHREPDLSFVRGAGAAHRQGAIR